jgi:tRNA threonylcarbamoyl adenosine modification protein YeaZ
LAPVLLLAFDTATPAVTVALHDGAHVLAETTTVDARRHGELLASSIDAVLTEAGAGRLDITAVAAGTGPGPYTGLRVGLVTARVLGSALGVPVYGVSTLDVIAADAAAAAGGREFIVATDARRREVYWARYRDGVRTDGPAVNAPADVPHEGTNAVAGWPDQEELFPIPRLDAESPSPVGLVRAVDDWAADPEPLVPLYLRRPDAKTLAERAGAERSDGD